MATRYITDLADVPAITEWERERLKQVTDRFAFLATEYYLSLINWDDPDDPIRRLIIPHPGELVHGGDLDPSSERTYTVVPGVQHKYERTALMLVGDMCGGFCRYCFRKRLFINGGRELLHDVSRGIEYISKHPEITNVLLTGGDPLTLPTETLEEIVRRLHEIEHVEIIRIGSKMPAYDPIRISEDESLLEMFSRYSLPEKRIYVMCQFTHPRELSREAIRAVEALLSNRAILYNQTPIIRGVNDDPDVLADLFQRLSFTGITPYYVFQCRPTTGNVIYRVPVEESYRIFEEARAQCSGLAKSARFIISHATGKIEVTGVVGGYVHFKYHQAANPADIGRVMVFRSNPEATWFDDYVDEVVMNGPLYREIDQNGEGYPIF
ncbi:MAG: KamA family radical SAM protein [Methanoculleaceae archaeon]